MSCMKRYYELIMERLGKAFPELSYDNIAYNMTTGNNMDEVMCMCLMDAEPIKVKEKIDKKTTRVNYVSYKVDYSKPYSKPYEVVFSGYSKDPRLITTKTFERRIDADTFVSEFLEYFSDCVENFGSFYVADVKRYIGLKNDIKFRDYQNGWLNCNWITVTRDTDSRSIYIKFDDPVHVPD